MRMRFTSEIRGKLSRVQGKTAAFVIAVIVASLGVSLAWFSGHHVVRTAKGVVVVEKRFFGLDGTFADIRAWTWDDAVARSDLSRALVRAGYADVLPSPPTTMDKATAKVREWRDGAVTAGTNVWQQLRAKYGKLGVRNEELGVTAPGGQR